MKIDRNLLMWQIQQLGREINLILRNSLLNDDQYAAIYHSKNKLNHMSSVIQQAS